MFPTVQNSIGSLSDALTHSKVNTTSSAGGKAFMKFDFKSGDFTFGRDAEEITGDEIVVNSYSFQHGWMLWVNSQPSKEMRSFTEDMPPAMPAVEGNQPSEARSFEARFEDDAETILSFETNSYGGRSGCDALLKAVTERAGQGETEYLFPVVTLDSESYKAKQGATIHNPMFNVVGWVNAEGERQEAEAPKLEQQAEETEEQPTRRRRRA